MLPINKLLPMPKRWPLYVQGHTLLSLGFTILNCFVWIVCICLLSVPSLAQTHRSCATVDINASLKDRRLGAETEVAFEKWLAGKIQDAQNKRNEQTKAIIYTIPVVVHVIHNGEPAGTGTNISDAQVQSQIRILNEDFRRKTASKGYNTNPVGADTEIEFKLALADPEGFPTSGIVRVRGTKQSWTTDDDVALKSLSNWPSENYMNIWVCNLGSNTLGYAQMPESDQVQGVSAIGEENAALDGLVIGYKYFGDVGTVLASGNDFRYGRTTTHEVGHFLGLRHIWGDAPSASAGCTYDDYCRDTPNTRQANYDCPTSDSTTCTIPRVREMVENYMDYTDDACMNVFTQEQKLRMRTILENSPRRLSLLSSPGLLPVVLRENNACIERILNPQPFLCESTFSPVIVLRNYGSNAIKEVTFRYEVGEGKEYEYIWTGNLATSQKDTLTLPLMQVGTGYYTFQLSISAVNGSSGNDPSNDASQTAFQIPAIQPVPLWANFTTTILEQDWLILNEDKSITWRDTLVESNLSGINTDNSNRVAYLNYYQYDNADEQDGLLTGVYDFSTVTQAYLMFDVSYARRQVSEDGLHVVVSTDCGNTFDTENPLYQKSGSRLATVTSASSQAWFPVLESDWRTETINLSQYTGQKALRFAFVGINDNGNNIYIDNVRIVLRPQTTEEEVNGYLELTKALQIYPNPGEGRFNLFFNVYEPLDIQVNVYNSAGQQVYAQLITQAIDAYEIDLSNLPAGMYLVNASSGNKKATKKIVIAR